MSTVFFILAIAAAAAVLATLAAGLIGMAQGGTFNARYGNRLMRARVVLQGLAIAFFALALWTSG